MLGKKPKKKSIYDNTEGGGDQPERAEPETNTPTPVADLITQDAPPIVESQSEPAAAAQNQPIATPPEIIIAIPETPPIAPAQTEEIAINQSENVATENISSVATSRQNTIAISREEDDAFSHLDAIAIYDDKVSALKRTVEEAKELQREAAKEIQSVKRLKRVQGPSRKLHNALVKLPETPQTALAIEIVQRYPTLKKPGLNAPESFHMIMGELAKQLQWEAQKTNPEAKVTATDLYQEYLLKGILGTLKKLTKKSGEDPE